MLEICLKVFIWLCTFNRLFRIKPPEGKISLHKLVTFQANRKWEFDAKKICGEESLMWLWVPSLTFYFFLLSLSTCFQTRTLLKMSRQFGPDVIQRLSFTYEECRQSPAVFSFVLILTLCSLFLGGCSRDPRDVCNVRLRYCILTLSPSQKCQENIQHSVHVLQYLQWWSCLRPKQRLKLIS